VFPGGNMQHLEIDMSSDEMKILSSSIDKYLSELRMEIADTDREEFREKLRIEKRILYKFLEKLEECNEISC
jgi:hypothetical protein